MNVLSLFDGISVARQALLSASIPVAHYYCCEIDKYASQISKKNWSDNVHLGNVKDFSNTALGIDLLIGGSPCQDLSIAKKGRKGLKGERSGLFWEYIRIKDLVKPKFFILENVASMSKADRAIINEAMGVEPVMFNASLVSAQCRKRLFWTNIKFDLPEDKGILLKDILEADALVDERMTLKGKAYVLTASYLKVSASEAQLKNSIDRKQRTMVGRIVGRKLDENGVRKDKQEGLSYTPTIEVNLDDKSNCLSTVQKDNIVVCKDRFRKLTPIECERLQSLPDGYTAGVSNSQRYKCLGNAFNCKVIEYIISHIHLPTK
jgi:DNA-cytosine methyltransferase